MVLNSGAGESNDEVKQQRIAALSAWKTKVEPPREEGLANKVKARLCLRRPSVASVRGGKPSIEARPPGSWIRGGSEAQVILS